MSWAIALELLWVWCLSLLSSLAGLNHQHLVCKSNVGSLCCFVLKSMLLHCCKLLACICLIPDFSVACHSIAWRCISKWLSVTLFLPVPAVFLTLHRTHINVKSHLTAEGWQAWLIVSRLNLRCRVDQKGRITCNLWRGLEKGPKALAPVISFHS